MQLDPNKLLVLKAYYLGRGLAASQERIRVATPMIERAIAHFSPPRSDEDSIRLFFYLLLKAELMRGSKEAIAVRGQAKAIADGHGLQLFELFMRIEESTQTLSRASDKDAEQITNRGVQTLKQTTVTLADDRSVTIEYDAALLAVGLIPGLLSERDKHYLHAVTLRQLLEMHGVPLS